MTDWQGRLRTALSTAGIAMIALILFGYLRPIELSQLITRSRLWAEGERSHNVKVEGYKIHYREMGQSNSKPLLLVHGLGGSSLDWAPVMRKYADAGYHVYAPDLLGYGKSQTPDVSYSIEEQTQIVHQFLQAMNIPQADVIGWSMGGWIALRLTLEYPTEVRRLVVNDSAGLYFQAGYPAETLTQVFAPETEAEVNHLYSLLEPTAKPMPHFVAADLTRRIRHENGWVIKRTVASMLTMKDLLDGKLGAIKQPVLITWGADDALIPVASGYDMAKQIPQADMEVFKGCGHLAPARCAGPVSQKTLQFLQAQEPPQGLQQEIAVNVLYWFPH
jgi:pimeloyl-ACP methyl ester carboxylesterase